MRELPSAAGLSTPVLADGVEMSPGVEAGSRSIWPSIYPALLELVETHRSTIIFVNNRRLAERLALRLNELAEKPIARAHHGSLAREQRVEIEELLKKGEIPALVATSSLELGVDMGAVDLVIQVESPKSVARGLQRVAVPATPSTRYRRAVSFRSSGLTSSSRLSSLSGCARGRSRRRRSRATRWMSLPSRSSRSRGRGDLRGRAARTRPRG